MHLYFLGWQNDKTTIDCNCQSGLLLYKEVWARAIILFEDQRTVRQTFLHNEGHVFFIWDWPELKASRVYPPFCMLKRLCSTLHPLHNPSCGCGKECLAMPSAELWPGSRLVRISQLHLHKLKGGPGSGSEVHMHTAHPLTGKTMRGRRTGEFPSLRNPVVGRMTLEPTPSSAESFPISQF